MTRFKLLKYQSRTNLRKHLFSRRVINSWNDLPGGVDATSTSDFKCLFNKFKCMFCNCVCMHVRIYIYIYIRTRYNRLYTIISLYLYCQISLVLHHLQDIRGKLYRNIGEWFIFRYFIMPLAFKHYLWDKTLYCA